MEDCGEAGYCTRGEAGQVVVGRGDREGSQTRFETLDERFVHAFVRGEGGRAAD